MKTNQILTAIAILFSLAAGVFAATSHFAPMERLLAAEQRLEYKIVSDAIIDIEKRIFIIETRHNINVPGFQPIPMTPDVLENYHKLRKQLEKLYKEQAAALGS